jgi:hypothetical protein
MIGLGYWKPGDRKEIDGCVSTIVLGGVIGEMFDSSLLAEDPALVLESQQLSSVTTMNGDDADDDLEDWFLRDAAEAHFRRCVNSSGFPRTNDGCAYMSVSGPLRTLEKPYCIEERNTLCEVIACIRKSQKHLHWRSLYLPDLSFVERN